MMKKRDELAVDKILECAKEEFLEKGFAEASMRNIAEKAGYTTGMLYGRFADKSELFNEIVAAPANELLTSYARMHEEFAAMPVQKQISEMYLYVDKELDGIIDFIYNNFDAFKLIVCKSMGTSYQYYLDKMIEIEQKSTTRFIKVLNEAGIKTKEVRADLNHILTSAMFNGIFEVVAHDFPRDEAKTYMGQLFKFFHAGWNVLLGLKEFGQEVK